MQHRVLSPRHNKDDFGFTIVELMVAIFIGLIVMGSSVAIIGATNSSALRVLAKSDVQQGSRDALIKLFSQVGDAESPSICRVAVSQAGQDLISSKPLGHPGSLKENQCKETSSSGVIVLVAQPNKLCYFKAPKSTSSSADKVPFVECISRGNEAYPFLGSPTPTVPASTNINGCAKTLGTSFSSENLYFYRCRNAASANFSSINWPYDYNVRSDIQLISELGSSGVSALNPPLFEYVLSNGSKKTSVSSEAEFKQIVAVDVALTFYYDSRTDADPSSYTFRSTIMLKGSELAREESAFE